jgi:hypothetical protein
MTGTSVLALSDPRYALGYYGETVKTETFTLMNNAAAIADMIVRVHRADNLAITLGEDVTLTASQFAVMLNRRTLSLNLVTYTLTVTSALPTIQYGNWQIYGTNTTAQIVCPNQTAQIRLACAYINLQAFTWDCGSGYLQPYNSQMYLNACVLNTTGQYNVNQMASSVSDLSSVYNGATVRSIAFGTIGTGYYARANAQTGTSVLGVNYAPQAIGYYHDTYTGELTTANVAAVVTACTDCDIVQLTLTADASITYAQFNSLMSNRTFAQINFATFTLTITGAGAIAVVNSTMVTLYGTSMVTAKLVTNAVIPLIQRGTAQLANLTIDTGAYRFRFFNARAHLENLTWVTTGANNLDSTLSLVNDVNSVFNGATSKAVLNTQGIYTRNTVHTGTSALGVSNPDMALGYYSKTPKTGVATIASGTTIAVTFGTPFPDTSYNIQLTPAFSTTGYLYYTNKTATGFTINCATTGQEISWTATRIGS